MVQITVRDPESQLAVRAARTSTVQALADSVRRPRRTRWLIALSTRLPVPLLLGLRVIALAAIDAIVITWAERRSTSC